MREAKTLEHQIIQRFEGVKDWFKNQYPKETIDIANCIVEILKEKELTYENAYAALSIAYEIIKYESNFIRLPKR